MSIKNLQRQKKYQVILTYFSAVKLYWINLTLRINGRSWHNQYNRDTICHHQHERDTTINCLINSNVGHDGTINNDKLNQAITDLKTEAKAGHERNILDMTQVDEYKSPGKNKDAFDNQQFVIS